MDNGCTCNGILSCIKLLPAIPPSAMSFANCIILSQIWQNIYGDAYEKELLKKILCTVSSSILVIVIIL